MQKAEKSPIYLVDGSGYIFRAFYAVPPLTTSSGFPTNAIFGFVKMMLKLLVESGDAPLAVVFDAGRMTFRNDLFPEYKANRSECPEDLIPQMPLFREVVQLLGFPCLEAQGYEADDLIGTLTSRFDGSREVLIVTADKDLMQLVSSSVSLWDTMRDKRVGEKEVEQKFGVPPTKVCEVLALIGDTSDNIPGIPGVGPKSAATLINKFKSVEGLLACAGEVASQAGLRNRAKIAKSIEENRDMVRLSRKLVEIDCHVPLEKIFPEAGQESLPMERLFAKGVPDWEGLQAFADKYEFQSLLDDIRGVLGGEVKSSSSLQAEPRAIFQPVLADDFEGFLQNFSRQKKYAFDLETTSLDPLEAKVVGVSFCWNEAEAYYIPLGHHRDAKAGHQVSWDDFWQGCRASFADDAVAKVGQNLKYDIEVLAAQGVEVAGPIFDTMVAAYLLRPDRRRYNMEALAEEYLCYTPISYRDVTNGSCDFASVEIAEATSYAAEDSWVAWRLSETLKPLIEERGLSWIAMEVEMPLVGVLASVQMNGVLLDTALLGEMEREFRRELDEITKEVHLLAGQEFNLNSPKQLSAILFDVLELPTSGVKKTKSGALSTDSSVLERLTPFHEVPRLLLAHRTVQKLLGTYIEGLPKQVSARTERLHTKLNQTATGTGRLSSSEPNLQNIPIQTKEGARIREAFVAPEGYFLLSADYSQIELRVLAHMSGDCRLIEAFANDLDIHEQTAREILDLGKNEEVSSEQRRMGKTINFGVVYGMSAFRLSKALGISVDEARHYIDQYFTRYAGVKDLFTKLKKEAEITGEVSTIFGRKRVLADINVGNRDRGFLDRVAMNAPVQGSAADIIKLAMIAVLKKLDERNFGARMVLQIHDELLFEVPNAEQEGVTTLVREEMMGVADMLVPLKVEVGCGRNWRQAH